ncbi:hypothetical protein [Flavisphingomonas formosensis]|uniref:hypothetical protein n=1 Tax=Flavisphingomonas formosensis TaxID=861534 RepID=UPI0012F96578|nr:hypothetical protein [Sphingomonas formosensis]
MKRPVAVLMLLLVAALAAASLLLRPGQRLADSYAPPVTFLPRVTLDKIATPEGPRLVVTSERSPDASDLNVGDRLEDIDGQPAPSFAALRHILAVDHAATLRLHVRRHDRLLTILVDRAA